MLTRIYIIVKQGATIVDQIVTITPAENYVPKRDTQVIQNQNQTFFLHQVCAFEWFLSFCSLQEVRMVDNSNAMPPLRQVNLVLYHSIGKNKSSSQFSFPCFSEYI